MSETVYGVRGGIIPDCPGELLMPADAAQSIPSHRNQAALVGGGGGEGRPNFGVKPRMVENATYAVTVEPPVGSHPPGPAR